jgi:alpha-tubulin suppressor-like RCC1 family protein
MRILGIMPVGRLFVLLTIALFCAGTSGVIPVEFGGGRVLAFGDGDNDGVGASAHALAIEASGNWFSFARMSDGTVYGWGNYYGDLPWRMEACRDSSGAFIRAGSASECEGEAGTWGTLSQVKSLSTGQNHTLVLIDNGTPGDISDDTVGAWGRNDDGQLGDDTQTRSSWPVQVHCGEMAETPFCSPAGFLQGVIAVAAGGGKGGYTGQSLAHLSDGSLVAWGWNGFGQLGNGTQENALTPVRVLCGEATGAHCSSGGFLTGVESIESSAASSYAILSDRTMVAWGNNSRGWLGDGTTTARSSPVHVVCGELTGTNHCTAAAHLQGVAQIAEDATSGHTVVLLNDGTVAAWGANSAGRLGNGTTVDSHVPVRVVDVDGAGLLYGVTQVAAGTLYSLALLSDGTAVAWGNNYAGQLGDGTTAHSTVPVPVNGLWNAVDIAAGYDHSHALLSDGSIIGWGQNNVAQLGLQAAGGISTPTHVLLQGGVPLSGTVAVSAGIQFSRALQDDETLLAWGGNAAGQLGDGTTTSRKNPVEVSGMGAGSGVSSMATGGGFSLALKWDGTVWAWGGNGSGQLGIGTTTDSPVPVEVPGLTDVAALASHTFAAHTLALKSDGTLLAWGGNSFGQLGDGTTEDRTTPTAVACGVMTEAEFCAAGQLRGVSAIAAGGSHSLALLSNGTVLEWGDGVTTPQRVVGLAGVAALGSRGLVSHALLANGTVFEWKTGETPMQHAGLENVAAIVGGSEHALALRTDGTVLAWGWNSSGQLGDGTTRGTPAPVQVMACRAGGGALIATFTNTTCEDLGGSLSPLTDVMTVAAGYDHSLAVLSDGTALAWGSRADGALADGSPGAIFTEPSVLMVVGTRDRKVALGPGLALVVGSDSTIRAKVQGDSNNEVVVGSRSTIEKKVKDVDRLVLDGSEIQVGEVTKVVNVRVSASGSATVDGDLKYTLSLVLEEGALLTVTDDLKCPSDAGASLDPSATLNVQGDVKCAAVGVN